MTKHILIVDSTPNSRFSSVIALKKVGYKTSETADGHEALAMILDARDGGEPFDMVLITIQMPEMIDMNLIYDLTKNKVSIPILVISDLISRTLMTELVRNCCSDLLLKPFDSQELVKRVEDIFKRDEKDFFSM